MNPMLPSMDVLKLVLPEIILILGMCAVIVVPFFQRQSKALPTWTTILTLIAAFAATATTFGHADQTILHNTLAIDPFSQFFKLLLIAFTLLVVLQWIAGARENVHPHDVPDFLCLVLGAAAGMAMLASANNLLMIFIAMESASFPSYALAGFKKNHRSGAEGSLKYILFGAAASAIMLYGMSLCYSVTGSLNPVILASAAVSNLSPVLALGLLAFFAGIAFKLSVVPLHFWCPDVFQGAPIEITTFLSVASKGAALALLIRLLQPLGLAGFAAGANPATGIVIALALIGAITATWGNLVALHQTNIQRLLAYSSIAHAGYMVMAASLLPITQPGEPSRTLIGALLLYLLVYLFMNLGAFTVAAIISKNDQTQNITDYAGLIKRNPLLAIFMILFLLSLFGMPGLGGFMAKIYLATAMLTAHTAIGYILTGVLLVNTLFSLYFYLRPIYYMVFSPPTSSPATASAHGHHSHAEDSNDLTSLWTPTGAALPINGVAMGLLLISAVALLWTGLLPSLAGELTKDHAVLVSALKPQPQASSVANPSPEFSAHSLLPTTPAITATAKP